MFGFMIMDTGEFIYTHDNFRSGNIIIRSDNYVTAPCSLLFLLIAKETSLFEEFE